MRTGIGLHGEQSLTRPRRAERRRGLDSVVAAVTSNLRNGTGAAGIRAAFEEALCKALMVPGTRLRSEIQLQADAPSLVPDEDGRLRVPVRSGIDAEPACLEITLQPQRQLDGWDRQLFGRAGQLAALVLEVERAQAWRGSGLNPVRSRDGAAPLIGTSAVMRGLRERIERLAATDFTVLIEGESGSGKELVARQIHELSRRRRGPFVAINCAALVETLLEAELFGIEDRTATGVRGRRGKFEHAAAGTLFLDEVSDLSLSAQAKLLRAIQECAVERVGGHQTYRVDLRLVVATNKRLTDMVERGLFREDLFYRLSGIDLNVPPLRTRREDILELARYFLQKHNQTRSLELSPSAADALEAYEWPGNVRELERLMEGAVALVRGPRIELDDLPPVVRGTYSESIQPSLDAGETLRHCGTRYVRLMFDRCGRNKRATCRVLDISYHTLQAYLKQGALADQVSAAAPSGSYPGSGEVESPGPHERWLNATPQYVHDGGALARLGIGTEP
jgi:transcriptional regulator with PAS, ATPase and Fis domain